MLFPRVVEAVAKEQHPGRILLSSAGILTALAAGALLVFAVVPGLVVGILFGPGFRDATPYVFAVGVIGLALALDNLLVQFFMAVHDRVFVPILALAVIAEGLLIFLFHARVGQVVLDVLVALTGLLVLLSIRCYVLLPTLHADSLAEPGAHGWLGRVTKLSPVALAGRGTYKNARQRPTLPSGYPDSTIGAGGLNYRVRNGNGCLPSAMVTEHVDYIQTPPRPLSARLVSAAPFEASGYARLASGVRLARDEGASSACGAAGRGGS